MTSFNIYQANLSDEASDVLNSVGWDGDFGEFDTEIRIGGDVQFFGSEKFEKAMFAYYAPVGKLQADDLDDVYFIGNMRHSEIEILGRMHSVSVGDIIENVENQEFFMVESEGFSKMEVA